MRHQKRLPANRQLRRHRRHGFDDYDQEEIEILIGFADTPGDLSKDVSK
jgi:hypothetical protein